MFGRMTAMHLVRPDAGRELEVAVAELLPDTDYPEIARWVQFPRGLMLFLLVPSLIWVDEDAYGLGSSGSYGSPLHRAVTGAVKKRQAVQVLSSVC